MAGVLLVTAGAAGRPLTVTVTNQFPVGYSVNPGTVYTAQPTRLNISGGTGPYTVEWTQTVGLVMDITSTTATTVTFYAYLSSNSTMSATWQASVTDSVGAEVIVTVQPLLTVGGNA